MCKARSVAPTARFRFLDRYNPSLLPLQAALCQLVEAGLPFSSITCATLLQADGDVQHESMTAIVLAALCPSAVLNVVRVQPERVQSLASLDANAAASPRTGVFDVVWFVLAWFGLVCFLFFLFLWFALRCFCFVCF